jgi:spore germination protein YaaH
VFDRGERIYATGSVMNSNIYSVAWGDTLFSIGRRFGVSVDDLRSANGLTEAYSPAVTPEQELNQAVLIVGVEADTWLELARYNNSICVVGCGG